jgi:hypothetical protein
MVKTHLYLETRAVSEKPTSGFPLALSFSWHNNMTAAACSQEMSASQQHLMPYNNGQTDIRYMDEVEKSPVYYQNCPVYQNPTNHYVNHVQSNGLSSLLFRPKRSRSISSNAHFSVNQRVVQSASSYEINKIETNGAGFRTPQSNANFKCKQALDAKFLALATTGLETTIEPSPIANSDFLYRRLETIGSGSYATVYKTQNR